MKNLEEVKIKTILKDKSNLFSFLRGSSGPPKEFIAKISDISFSDKDIPNSPIIRIMIGDKRYYCHKNRSAVHDYDLLKAIFTPGVNKIECLR